MRELAVVVMVGCMGCTGSSSMEGTSPEAGVWVLDSGTLDGETPDTDASVFDAGDASCIAPTHSATRAANRCPVGDLCPDCTLPILPDGVYVQLSTLPVFASACGSCQPHGTLRIASGVFDLVADESPDICTGYLAQQTHVRGPYTLEGDTLHVVDGCGAGALAWIVRASESGMLRLIPADQADAAPSSPGLVFQRQ